ncbi:hypothetical protein N9080_04295 [Akkermansiaceae bacterium]|nr:hypothetical protein [Akkermansiaceae bacterium]
MLESLEYFIFVCDDAELNRREILQSERDFITKKARLIPSCVLEAGFVSLEAPGKGKVMIWGKPKNLKRSFVISRSDGTRFDVIAPIQMESLFGVPQKLKCNEQYENSDAFTLNLHVFLLN